MIDIAALGVEVQTGDISRARRELSGLVADGKRAEQATDRLSASSQGLGRALAGVAAVVGVRQVVQYADAYEAVNARLRLVTSSAENFSQVQSALIAQADQTRTGLGETVELYARIARSTRELGASDKERLQVTENINKALIVSGASGASAQAALMQLGQGLASGTLRGEELNSVLEQAPRLAEAIAEGLGVSVGRLREMGQAGQLTSSQVFRALLSQTENIEREFAGIPVTIGQALTVAENRLQVFVGETSKASGAGQALASVIVGVSRNLDVLTAAALGFGAAKLAHVILETAAAGKTRIGVLAAEVAAQRAALAATAQSAAASLGQAQAEAANTATKVAGLQATQAAIIGARADATAKLQSAQAAIAQSQAQIAAARSAGALSFALAAVREGENALAAAQARRAVLVSELAVLGQQQARVSAATAAATVAQTTATNALTAAQTAAVAAQGRLAAATGAGAVATGLASRALGLLGGPIGAITTVLGLGVTAWALWGSSAERAEGDAAGAVEKSTSDILADLNRQIAKIKERNALAAQSPQVGSIGGEAGDRLGTLLRQITELRDRSTEAAHAMSEPARQGLLQTLMRQYGELGGAAARLAEEQGRVSAADGSTKVEKFLRKYASEADRVKIAVQEAREELGALFTPQIQAQIEGFYAAKADKKADPFADEAKSLRERAALLGLNTELERTNAQIALSSYGRLSVAQTSELRRLAQAVDARQKVVDALQAEERARDAATAALTAASRRQLQDVESLEDGNRAIREEIELIGAGVLTQAAIEKARIRSTRTLKEETRARLEASGVHETQLQVLDEEIRLLREREELIDDRAFARSRESLTSSMRSASDATRDSLADSIEQGILDGGRRGLDIMEIVRRELVAQFARTVLRPIISPVAEAGSQVLGALVQAIGGAIGGLISPYSGTSTNPSAPNYENSFDRGEVLASYAVGTNRVPKDGPYYLHEDEAVVPKAYNPAVGGSAGGSTVVNVRIENAPQGAQVSKSTNSRGETDVLIRFQEQLIGAVAGDIRSGQGPVSSALAANGMNRSAGLR